MKKCYIVRFGVFKLLPMKNTVFWDVTPHGLLWIYQCFGGNSLPVCLCDDWGRWFLWNVAKWTNFRYYPLIHIEKLRKTTNKPETGYLVSNNEIWSQNLSKTKKVYWLNINVCCIQTLMYINVYNTLRMHKNSQFWNSGTPVFSCSPNRLFQ